MAPAASIRKPAYWPICQQMYFGQLRHFIDESLHQLEAPDSHARPRTKQEFTSLWDMLAKKIHASDLPELPPAPTPPPDFPPFVPSEQLRPFFDQRAVLSATLDAARRNPSATKRSIKKLEHKLRFLDQDMVPLESPERHDYTKRRDDYYRPYWEAKVAHERTIQDREEEIQASKQFRLERLQIAERVRRDIEHTFEFGIIIPKSRLAWRILPPSELSLDTVLQHFDRLQRLNPHIRYEKERIIKAFSLRPDQCYVGIDEFDGYIVLTFSRGPRALLECPIFGNAVYIIDSGWKSLCRLTKQELMMHHSREVTRIVHAGDWFWRVKSELGIRDA